MCCEVYKKRLEGSKESEKKEWEENYSANMNKELRGQIGYILDRKVIIVQGKRGLSCASACSITWREGQWGTVLVLVYWEAFSDPAGSSSCACKGLVTCCASWGRTLELASEEIVRQEIANKSPT